MSAYSIIPSDATTYRAGMVNAQLGSPLKAARSMPQPALVDARSSPEIFGEVKPTGGLDQLKVRAIEKANTTFVLGVEDQCPLSGIMLWQTVSRVYRKNVP